MKLAKKKAFTLIELIFVTSVIALLATIAIPSLLRAKIMANDSNAKATLNTLAKATNMYSVNHAGEYPSNVTSLMGAVSTYLKEDYCGITEHGYTFTCTFATDSYTFQATPLVPGTSGTTTYTVTTGGIVIP